MTTTEPRAAQLCHTPEQLARALLTAAEKTFARQPEDIQRALMDLAITVRVRP